MRHQERTRQQFEKRTFDVTSQCERYCRCICCPCVGLSTTKLELGPDEAVLSKHDCCNHIVQKRPYAQLGSVDSHHECGICWSVGSDLTGRDGRLMPGWGCNAPLVREIVEELQERKLGRGNVAQMRSHEDLAASVAHAHAKLDTILSHLGLEPPAPPPPPPAEALAVAPLPAAEEMIRM